MSFGDMFCVGRKGGTGEGGKEDRFTVRLKKHASAVEQSRLAPRNFYPSFAQMG